MSRTDALTVSLPLSIIIPVGPGRDASAALTSLLKAGLEEGDEVILVGDGHKPIIPEMFCSLPLRIDDLDTGSGANAARNRGAAMAVNDIFCFLDDDDAYAVNALSVLRQRLLEEGDVSAWSLGWSFRSGRSSRSRLRPNWLIEAKIRKRNLAGGCSSMVLAREAFEAAGGFDPDLPAMQDWDLWLRVVRDRPIKVLSDVSVIYEDRMDSRISNDLTRRIAGFTRLLEKYGKYWPLNVIAFHQSRLEAVRYDSGSGSFLSIFRWRAPFASVYFMWQALRKPKT